MPGRSSQVTVISPDRRVDLSLPGSVPLGELMAQLLDVCTDHHDRNVAFSWILRPVGGSALSWASTLDAARVLDGAVLELSPGSGSHGPVRLDDVRDAVEDVVDETVGTWSRRHGTTIAALMLAALATLLLARADLWASSSENAIALSLSASLALHFGGLAFAKQDLAIASHALVAVGLVWTGALALAVTASSAPDAGRAEPAGLASSSLAPGPRAALCALTVVIAALALGRASPRLTAWPAAVTVALLAALAWAGLDIAGASLDDAVAVAGVLGVLSLGVLPRVSLAAGGLAQLDYRVRTEGSIEPTVVSATFARSRMLLTGCLSATAVLIAVASVQLGFADTPLQRYLGAAIACCLLLRARAFSQFQHVLTLVLAGTGALLTQLGGVLIWGHPDLLTHLGLLILLGGTAVVLRSGVSAPNDVGRARTRRMLDVAESLAVATLMPLLAADLGVLDWVRELVG